MSKRENKRGISYQSVCPICGKPVEISRTTLAGAPDSFFKPESQGEQPRRTMGNLLPLRERVSPDRYCTKHLEEAKTELGH